MRAALLLLTLSSACTADAIGQRAEPIREGARTSGDPAVVALVARRARCVDQDLTLLCTGTLVAPKVVLTAAHCLEAFGEDGAYEVLFGPSLDAPDARFVWVRRAKIHPGYVPDTHENDLALLELDEAGPVAPVVSATTPLAALRIGASARIVGFGETRTAEPPGIKRTGGTTIESVSENEFQAGPKPSMSCAGDSGGPVFVSDADGAEKLAGVTVRGDPACKTFAVNLRVDAYFSSFVQPFIEAVATSPPAPGATISLDAICRNPCEAGSVCPRATTCLVDDDGASRCTMPSLGSGAFDSSCTRDDQCSAGARCARLAPSGADACACFRPCNPLGEIAAGPPEPIAAVGGGCAVARPTRGGGGSFVGALLTLAIARAALRGFRRPSATPPAGDHPTSG